MRLLLLLSLLALGHGAPRDTCDETNCARPSCACFTTKIPGGLDVKDVPQMVMLTYDDAITQQLYDRFYSKNLFDRQNPNGCNISATFFTTHEYNDYHLTYQMYRQGHEIALHSITHMSDIDHWKDATVEELTAEYIGQRDILTKFALLPVESLKGIRSPFLQLAGDNSFEWMKENNIEWDCSWGTRQNGDPPVWPYTLDFKSPQDCPIPPCPESTFPGIWEVPMVDWTNDDDIPCSMVDTCPIISDPDDLYNFILKNFNRHYTSNKAPFPFFIHAAWFAADDPMRFDVYNKFLDYLKTLPDVYIVSISQVLEWMKNPVPISQMQTFGSCWQIPDDQCRKGKNCELIKQDTGETRYMKVCTPDCPQVYPWVGNPSGSAF